MRARVCTNAYTTRTWIPCPCAVAHSCHAPDKIGLNKVENIGRFLDKLLITSRAFVPEEPHIKGFPVTALNRYLGRAADNASEVLLAKTGVFGGTRAYLEVAALAHDAIVRATLTAGHMGGDEQVFTSVCRRCILGVPWVYLCRP